MFLNSNTFLEQIKKLFKNFKASDEYRLYILKCEKKLPGLNIKGSLIQYFSKINDGYKGLEKDVSSNLILSFISHVSCIFN